MNQMKIFKNKEFGEIRITTENGKEIFAAAECAKMLGYANPHKAIKDHCTNPIFICTNDSLGRQQNQKFIAEGDLYRLIVRSKLPTAEKFERWVFDEVLPSIRSNGAYMTPETIEKTLNDPDFIIKLATQLKEEQQKRIEAEHFNKQIACSKNSILVRELAKVASKNNIIIGEKKLYKKLREWGLIFKSSTEPKQRYIDRGYFEVVEGTRESNSGTFTYKTTRVTGKGQVYIINRLIKESMVTV